MEAILIHATENAEILKKRTELWNQKPGPRVGDYLKIGDKYTRFTHKWDDKIQTGGGVYGSYYMGGGYSSYSGGLHPGINLTDIKKTDEVKQGQVWFFDKDVAGAGRGVYFMIDCSVYVPNAGADLSGVWDITKEV